MRNLDARSFEGFLNVLLEDRSLPHFISEKNFIFNENKDRLITADLRVVINDLTSSVPKHALLHVGSICLMMLTKKIEYAIGHDRIVSYLAGYGEVLVVLSLNNYLHLTIQNRNIFKSIFSSKRGNLVQKSK